jgi:5-hydroxyisourate hydrolase
VRLSTHVLDVSAGHPAEGVAVRADRWEGGWQVVASAFTDADGRVAALVSGEEWAAGRWRLTFELSGYLGEDAFFPTATVEFNVPSPDRLHIPLLLSPFGYTTYRGS